jgi:hypothetical protein
MEVSRMDRTERKGVVQRWPGEAVAGTGNSGKQLASKFFSRLLLGMAGIDVMDA